MKAKPKTKYVYKIVGSSNNTGSEENTYASGYVQEKGVRVTYKIGKFTFPIIKGSKLFAFRTLQAAKDYAARSSYGKHVFQAIAKKGKRRFTRGYVLYIDQYEQEFRSFWNRKGTHGWYPVPKNTVFCDAIKLIEEV